MLAHDGAEVQYESFPAQRPSSEDRLANVGTREKLKNITFKATSMLEHLTQGFFESIDRSCLTASEEPESPNPVSSVMNQAFVMTNKGPNSISTQKSIGGCFPLAAKVLSSS